MCVFRVILWQHCVSHLNGPACLCSLVHEHVERAEWHSWAKYGFGAENEFGASADKKQQVRGNFFDHKWMKASWGLLKWWWSGCLQLSPSDSYLQRLQSWNCNCRRVMLRFEHYQCDESETKQMYKCFWWETATFVVEEQQWGNSNVCDRGDYVGGYSFSVNPV